MPTLDALRGVGLHCVQVGTGFPCLVMHGALGLDHTWLHPWLDPLGDELQLIYYDHRGNGRSGRPDPRSISFETLCSDADGLRAHLGHAKVAVIGWSLGGLIAMNYALRHPDRVSHLILIGATPYIDFSEFMSIAQRRGANAEQIAAISSVAHCSDDGLARAFEVLLPLYFHSYRGDEFLRLASNTRWSGSAFRRGAELAAGLDLRPRLGEISAPTLIVSGDDDFVTPVTASGVLHRGIPHSELQVIARSGHMPYFEQPDAFFSVTRNWLLNWRIHAEEAR